MTPRSSGSRDHESVEVVKIVAHVAVAMKHHGDRMRRHRERPPAGWDELFDFLIEVTQRMQGPPPAVDGHERPPLEIDRPPLEPLLLEARDAALALGTSTRTLRRWTADGRIEAHRQGGRVRYSTAELRRFADTKDTP